MPRRVVLLSWAVLALLPACSRQAQPGALDRLQPCALEDGPTDAYCGVLPVFENRRLQQGRRINLSIVVLPALSNDPQPDPLFFLAGGPGQAAARMAREVRDNLSRIQQRRDIVLVDQRGTGRSNPLDCKPAGDSLSVLNESDEAGFERLRKCLGGYDADVRFYTTPLAMDDLDDVRAFLGYQTINLFGVSYGTRAALSYLRQHGEHVRSVILDGVVPPDMRLPLFAARDAQQSLDKLLSACDADERCRTSYPNLAGRLRNLLSRLDREPALVTLVHPRTGLAEQVRIDARFMAGTIFGALYVPVAASLVPALVERGERNDFQGMVALAMLNEPAVERFSIGMQLSVLCAEDASRVSQADVNREAAGTVFGSRLMAIVKGCEFWPRGDVDPQYFTPVTSTVPALLFSGELDPITPPVWGDAVAMGLPNSRHLVVPGTGHGASGSGCGMRLLNEFLDRGSADGLDPACLHTIRRPPFFVTPSGPDPGATTALR